MDFVTNQEKVATLENLIWLEKKENRQVSDRTVSKIVDEIFQSGTRSQVERVASDITALLEACRNGKDANSDSTGIRDFIKRGDMSTEQVEVLSLLVESAVKAPMANIRGRIDALAQGICQKRLEGGAREISDEIMLLGKICDLKIGQGAKEYAMKMLYKLESLAMEEQLAEIRNAGDDAKLAESLKSGAWKKYNNVVIGLEMRSNRDREGKIGQLAESQSIDFMCKYHNQIGRLEERMDSYLLFDWLSPQKAIPTLLRIYSEKPGLRIVEKEVAESPEIRREFDVRMGEIIGDIENAGKNEVEPIRILIIINQLRAISLSSIASDKNKKKANEAIGKIIEPTQELGPVKAAKEHVYAEYKRVQKKDYDPTKDYVVELYAPEMERALSSANTKIILEISRSLDGEQNPVEPCTVSVWESIADAKKAIASDSVSCMERAIEDVEGLGKKNQLLSEYAKRQGSEIGKRLEKKYTDKIGIPAEEKFLKGPESQAIIVPETRKKQNFLIRILRIGK